MATPLINSAPPPTIDLSNPLREEGFSSTKYFKIALVVTAVALAIFNIYFQAAVVLMGIASWYAFSTVVILAHQVAEGSSLEKSICKLYVLITRIHSIFYAISLFPFTFFGLYHAPRGSKEGTPILLLNGYLSFGSTWDYQRRKLAEANLGPIHTMNIGSGKSIRVYAEQVGKKIQKILEKKAEKEIILVGHSKGGLVASYYASILATEETTVKYVVTIGSPLAGTPFARVCFGQDAEEMTTNSLFTQDLREKITQCVKTHFFYIASEEDGIVSKESALLGKDSSHHFVLKDLGHLSLLFSSRVAHRLIDLLQSEPVLV